MIYDFTIKGDCLTLDSRLSAVSGGVNCYICRFAFDRIWDNLTRFAVFTKGEDAVTVYLEGDECLIPSELLAGSGTIAVGVYGTRLEEEPFRISTNLSHIVIKEGAYREANAPEVPEAELWEVFLREASAKITETAEEERTKLEGYAEKILGGYFGDIDSALDEIIAEQNSLIGGDGE